jgi:Flp pilus assembly pilin Flp
MNFVVLRTWLEARLALGERGASLVEYVLLVGLIGLAVLAAVWFLRDSPNLHERGGH